MSRSFERSVEFEVVEIPSSRDIECETHWPLGGHPARFFVTGTILGSGFGLPADAVCAACLADMED